MIDFWKPQPKAPWRDWRTYSLIVPLILSAMAFALFSVFTYALDDIIVVPALVQSWLIIAAAFCAALGAEAGTPFTIIEVFRKKRIGEVTRWDWFALGASFAATLVVVTIGMAARITHTLAEPAQWAIFLTTWGTVIVGAVVVLDGYGGMVECGDLFGSFEQRMEAWLMELKEHQDTVTEQAEKVDALPDPLTERLDAMAKLFEAMETQIRALTRNVERLAQDISVVKADNQELHARIDRLAWPVARKADFDAYLATLNGERGTLTNEKLKAAMAERHLTMPSLSTSGRWLNGVK
jgi:hypothetical protein